MRDIEGGATELDPRSDAPALEPEFLRPPAFVDFPR
jgi:hypothetical protein